MYKRTDRGAVMKKSSESGKWYYVSEDDVPLSLWYGHQKKSSKQPKGKTQPKYEVDDQGQYWKGSPGDILEKISEDDVPLSVWYKLQKQSDKQITKKKTKKVYKDKPPVIPTTMIDYDIQGSQVDSTVDKDFMLLHGAMGINIPDANGTFYGHDTKEGKSIVQKVRKNWRKTKYRSIRDIFKNVTPKQSLVGLQNVKGEEFVINFLGIFRPTKTPCYFYDGTMNCTSTRHTTRGPYVITYILPALNLHKCKGNIIVKGLTLRRRSKTVGVGHLVMVVFNKKEKTIAVIDSNGNFKSKWRTMINKSVTKILSHYPELKTFSRYEPPCPRVGPQGVQEHRKKGGYCAAWSQWFAIESMLNPSTPTHKVVENMIGDGLTPKQLLDDIEKFVNMSEHMLSHNPRSTTEGFRQTFRSPFVHKKYNGFHVTQFRNGTHAGFWENGKMNGEGMFRSKKSGNTLKGKWKDGFFSGSGKYDISGYRTLSGVWKNGLFVT